MEDIDLVKVGFISKTHGYEGILRLSVDPDFLEAFEACQFLFIDIETMQIPFRIKNRQVGHHILCKLEEIDSKEDAQRFNSAHIFIERKYITHSEEDLSMKSLSGYMILQEGEQIGVLKDIQEFPNQLMGIILRGDKEIMIPLHEQLVQHIDHSLKTITVHLPEGLLDLNEGN